MEEFGGSLLIESKSGSGPRITATLPVERGVVGLLDPPRELGQWCLIVYYSTLRLCCCRSAVLAPE